MKKGSVVQTDIDSYINVVNKKRELLKANRFAPLSEEEPIKDTKCVSTVVNTKPPPIYLRERSHSLQVQIHSEKDFLTTQMIKQWWHSFAYKEPFPLKNRGVDLKLT